MTNSLPIPTHRKIRSFIQRQGRITPGQQMALQKFWPTFCLDSKLQLEPQTVFGRKAPLFLEIGFGNGESLLNLAMNNPDNDYIGIEVHKPGVGHLLLQLQENNINNVRIYCHDAVEILQNNIPDDALQGVFLFFPDPWHKKKHHKRRIVQSDFIALLSRKLKAGGFFHAATDWEDYAQQMLCVLNNQKNLQNKSQCSAFSAKPDYRTLTKFEKRGLKLGHGVWDLIFIKSVL